MFNPFEDPDHVGYSRNTQGTRDMRVVEALQHEVFRAQLPAAAAYLAKAKGVLTYSALLQVHKILFSAFYPWAGSDRASLRIHRLITKGPAGEPGSVEFAPYQDVQLVADWGLTLGNNPDKMRAHPGAVYGFLAYAHPFLDGNGRAIMLMHSELCHRAGFRIHWSLTKKRRIFFGR